MRTFGERLSYLRHRKGLSQEEFSKLLSIGKSTLGMYETNKREPGHDMTSHIAAFFEVSVDWLTTGKEFAHTPMASTQEEIIIKDLVQRYNIDLTRERTREKLEKIIQLVFEETT
ncbi:helix-turn-helix domain-containing protein [Paenibacillus lignilyticus]|uniref:Helix-turn-helix transcriptional regulator n=1 Tax=Paenibacillus lignilyticus TaxID=1172615 RepID=A0ABS5CI92_9BACL|nr:helix-turn-helix transcriptional regulator [Paenibacillus lignilyticus]MBP3965593.1 helix-turn-helix transcriptional regulator [Paenibacillus lignilyticus]